MRVLFVCDGNICRSPLAAEYLRYRSLREGLSHIAVDSAGLLGIEGASAAPLSIAVGRDAGLDLTRHRSRGVSVANMGTADLVIAMTLAQLEALERRYPTASQTRLLLRAFEKGAIPRGGAPELDDPVAGPVEEYREAFAMIRNCVDHLVLHLKRAP